MRLNSRFKEQSSRGVGLAVKLGSNSIIDVINSVHLSNHCLMSIEIEIIEIIEITAWTHFYLRHIIIG